MKRLLCFWYMVLLLLWLVLKSLAGWVGYLRGNVRSLPIALVVRPVQGYIARMGIEICAVGPAELPEARPVPVTGARATLPVEAALAIVTAEPVKAEFQRPGAVGAATAAVVHHGFVEEWLGLGRCRCGGKRLGSF